MLTASHAQGIDHAGKHCEAAGNRRRRRIPVSTAKASTVFKPTYPKMAESTTILKKSVDFLDSQAISVILFTDRTL
jgi:hypothetical protein